MCVFDKIDPKAKGTTLKGYKYECPLPHLDAMMRHSSILVFGL